MKRTRFLLVFFGLLIAFEVPLIIPWVEENVIHPINRGITTVSAGVLNVMAQNVRVSGTVISGHCFAVDLKTGCNGVEATLFLVAAILAFPGPAVRQRFQAALIGAGALQLANLIRVISLYLLGCYQRSWFDAFHLAVWQTLIFGLAVGMFLVWTRRVTTAHAR
jgi:exosortase H (IPTLxxWG-CTERM-specific)